MRVLNTLIKTDLSRIVRGTSVFLYAGMVKRSTAPDYKRVQKGSLPRHLRGRLPSNHRSGDGFSVIKGRIIGSTPGSINGCGDVFRPGSVVFEQFFKSYAAGAHLCSPTAPCIIERVTDQKFFQRPSPVSAVLLARNASAVRLCDRFKPEAPQMHCDVRNRSSISYLTERGWSLYEF
jgi:hypothetical protein